MLQVIFLIEYVLSKLFMKNHLKMFFFFIEKLTFSNKSNDLNKNFNPKIQIEIMICDLPYETLQETLETCSLVFSQKLLQFTIWAFGLKVEGWNKLAINFHDLYLRSVIARIQSTNRCEVSSTANFLCEAVANVGAGVFLMCRCTFSV